MQRFVSRPCIIPHQQLHGAKVYDVTLQQLSIPPTWWQLPHVHNSQLCHKERRGQTVFRRVLSTLSTHVASRAKVIFRRGLLGVVPGESPLSAAVVAAPSHRPRALRPLPPRPPLPPPPPRPPSPPSVRVGSISRWKLASMRIDKQLMDAGSSSSSHGRINKHRLSGARNKRQR